MESSDLSMSNRRKRTQNGDETLINKAKLIKGSGWKRRILIRTLLVTAICVFGLQRPLARSTVVPQTHTVSIKGFKFVPDTLTVNAGDTIVWKNEDNVTHTATAEGRAFDSRNIPYGASWDYVADRKGTYPYVCTRHPTMKGKLIVQ
jgi:plastocyanin